MNGGTPIEQLLRKHPAVSSVAVRDGVVHVVPDSGWAAGGQLSAWGDKRVTAWQLIWDRAYTGLAEGADATFNLTTWNSSYDGRPIADEWVGETVRRIATLRPRRVLEIGCGTGLLLFRLAPGCERYVGCDFSAGAIGYLQKHLTDRADLAQVELRLQAADQFDGIDAGAFDTVILNSVAAYFPNLDYLTRVLEGARRALRPGGRIFVGDVRSLPLLRALHASVQAHKAAPQTTREELRRRVGSAQGKEGELVIDPHYFLSWPGARVQVKGGQIHNEVTRFRYDVVLPVGTQSADLDAPLVHFATLGSLSALRAQLETEHPAALAITAIPDARLDAEVPLLAWLDGHGSSQTIGELRPRAGSVDPEALWALGRALGFHVEVAPSPTAGLLDAYFTRSGASPIKRLPWPAPARLSTDPLAQRRGRQLLSELERVIVQALGAAPPLAMCDQLPEETA